MLQWFTGSNGNLFADNDAKTARFCIAHQHPNITTDKPLQLLRNGQNVAHFDNIEAAQQAAENMQ